MKLPSLSILRGAGLVACFALPLSSFALDPPPPPPTPAEASAAPARDWTSGYSQVMANNNIPANERVSGDVVAVMGDNTVDGYVGRDVRTVRGNTTINGTVGRDVIATMGDVVLGPHSVVGRNVVCVGGSLTRAPGSIVRGRIITRRANSITRSANYYEEPRLRRLLRRVLPIVSDWPPTPFVLHRVLWTLDIVFVGLSLLLALVFPQGIRRCGDTLTQRPALTILMAFLVPFALPLLIVLLCITLIGIPVVIFFLPLAILAATVFGTASIYALIGRGMSGDRLRLAPTVLLGAAFCGLFNLIPVLGVVFFVALSTLGLGCAVAALFGSAKPAAAPPPVPPSPPPVPAVSAPLPAVTADPAPGGTPTDPPPLTAAAAIPPISSTLPRAGFWVRMGALFLDALIICVFAHLWFMAIAVYAAVMWKLKGTTVGGIVFGLEVVRIDGRPMEWETAIVRALGCYLSAVVFGLGFLWIAFDGEKQAWHDKIAGTVVVRKK